MRALAGFSMLAIAVFSPLAMALDCQNPLTQVDMNQCAYQGWMAADQDLNATYQLARRAAESWSPAALNALVRAQRAWIPYRDAACEAEGFLFEGGSMAPLIVSSCKEELTRRRTEDLRSVYEEH